MAILTIPGAESKRPLNEWSDAALRIMGARLQRAVLRHLANVTRNQRSVRHRHMVTRLPWSLKATQLM
jgi:hypothetical protein